MHPSTTPSSIILSKVNPRPLDELLEPIAALIQDPRNSDDEAARIIERLSYLVTRGPARDGRAEFLKSFAVASMGLVLDELNHGADGGDPNWFKLAQMFNVTPRVARQMFPRRPSRQ